MIYAALTALKRGDASVRLPMHGTAAFGKVAEVFNDVVDQNERMADELQRLSQDRRQGRQAEASARRWATCAASGRSRSTASTR